jgi:hypothetical protein
MTNFPEKSVDIGLSVATKDEELARVAGRSDETDRRDYHPGGTG